MLIRIFTALCVAVACAGGTAQAATVSVQDGVLMYVAEPGEENAVELAPDSDVDGLVYVYEYSAEIAPGTGCVPVPEPFALTFLEVVVTLHCTGVESVDVALSDGDDYAGTYTDGPAKVDGGDGRDDVWGSYGDDVLAGGAGDDNVVGGPGKDTIDGGDGIDRLEGDYMNEGETGPLETTDGAADVLTGGAGDDILTGGIGNDVIAGGDGRDVVDYSARDDATTVTLDGAPGDGRAGESDALAGDVESVITGRGADRVTGDAGPNVVNTGAGDDTVDPGAGADELDTGDGKDSLALRDGAVDTVDCGEGVPDAAVVDDADITGGCESISRPGGPAVAPAAPARAVPAGLTLQVGARRGARSHLKLSGRLRLPAGSPATGCAGGLVHVVAKVGKRKMKLDVPLDARCRFSASVPVRMARRARVQATATFGGTAALAPAKSKKVRTRAR